MGMLQWNIQFCSVGIFNHHDVFIHAVMALLGDEATVFPNPMLKMDHHVAGLNFRKIKRSPSGTGAALLTEQTPGARRLIAAKQFRVAEDHEPRIRHRESMMQ